MAKTRHKKRSLAMFINYTVIVFVTLLAIILIVQSIKGNMDFISLQILSNYGTLSSLSLTIAMLVSDNHWKKHSDIRRRKLK